MYILGLDTSLNCLNIGLGKDDRLISKLSLNNSRQHTDKIYKHIESVLNYGGVTIKDLDCFAAVVGPGSFTGIRIAVTAVKALAYTLGKDVVALSSLDLLALNASHVEGNIVVSLIDGKRNNLYFAKYDKAENNFKRISEEILIPIKEVGDRLKDADIILGDGVEIFKKLFPNLENTFNFLDKDNWSIKPKHMIELAFNHWSIQNRENIFDLKPVYIYPKECTIKR